MEDISYIFFSCSYFDKNDATIYAIIDETPPSIVICIPDENGF